MRAALKIDVVTWALHSWGAASLPAPVTPEQIIRHDGGYLFAQPPGANRHAWIAPCASGLFDADALNQWRLSDIDAGLPLLAAELGGQFVAQALDLERLAAIRFDKGCYPGQEIAARLHFRGGNKRHLRRVRVHGEVPLPGAAILDAERAMVGRILYGATHASQESNALAVLTNVSDGDPLLTENRARVLIHTCGIP